MLGECLIKNCSHLEIQGESGRGIGTRLRTISVEVENGVLGVNGLSEGQQEERCTKTEPWAAFMSPEQHWERVTESCTISGRKKVRLMLYQNSYGNLKKQKLDKTVNSCREIKIR